MHTNKGDAEIDSYDFFVGVPSSELKDWIAGLEGRRVIFASNECEAVGIATGYHLATGRTPVVFLGIAGLGKIVNPVTSLTHLYDIPIKWVIGYRDDEPQHWLISYIFPGILNLLEIKDDVTIKGTSIRTCVKTVA